jgi:XTP/dITP diphosphohydrolase
MEILLASNNLHKIREFRQLFQRLQKTVELVSLIQFPHYKAPEETGLAFKENAIAKAVHAAKELQMWVLADDSGLVVPSLQGAPGVYSSRYAGIGATDKQNYEKLLGAMKNFSEQDRIAYFQCCLALANPFGLQKCVESICEGSIADTPRGRCGFGYDSIFIKTDYGKTFAELDDEIIKNKISHRGKAFERILPFLETFKNS